jgi:hypothetical protein
MWRVSAARNNGSSGARENLLTHARGAALNVPESKKVRSLVVIAHLQPFILWPAASGKASPRLSLNLSRGANRG